jgi:hypothetical protein
VRLSRSLNLRWCPSIACMQYAQRAHACWTLPKPGTRSTSGVRYGVRQRPQSSGDGGLRSVCRSAEIASRDVRPGRRSFDSQSLIPVRGWSAQLCQQVRRTRRGPWKPLSRPARPVSDHRHFVALLYTLSRDTTRRYAGAIFAQQMYQRLHGGAEPRGQVAAVRGGGP